MKHLSIRWMVLRASPYIFSFSLLSSTSSAGGNSPSPPVLSLAGIWKVRLDPEDAGVHKFWQVSEFADTLRLPGSLTEHNYGEDISVRTRWTGSIIDSSWFADEKYARYRQPGMIKLPFWLTPRKHYVGAAWYQREIFIPDGWRERHVQLFLERAHWETEVWLDGTRLGTQNSLCAPHEYELGAVAPGRHRLAVKVDNRQKIWVGSDAHSICDHTQTNWNGLIGALELRVYDRIRMRDIQVYPDLASKSARVLARIDNGTGSSATVTLVLTPRPANGSPKQQLSVVTVRKRVPPGRTTLEARLRMGATVRLWDEFSPEFYRLDAELSARSGTQTLTDRATTSFGMREFRTRGTNFILNGKVTFLRGTLEACVFPLTGYPPMETPEWERIFGVAKAHGLNHIRFHSWCPPEAAFEAADRLGFILHIETPVWTRLGQDSTIDSFIYDEGDRILSRYGNHPSFCMLAVGNEPSGDSQRQFLSTIVPYWKQKDPRRLYTTTSGWPILPVSDFNSTPDPRVHAWGAALNCRFNSQPLSTDTDYVSFVSRYTVPTVSHEIGQWCAYPDLKETAQYTGVLRAENFEIVREDLARKKMLDQADSFLMASGKLQVLEYKEEIEAALRTRGFGGFQLLGLHDFPGQGTALVGMLNPFWRTKGYLKPEEFHRFCSAAVPLLRAKKFVWTNQEQFRADAEFANYSAADLKDALPEWKLTRPDGSVFASGSLVRRTIPQGDLCTLGSIITPLNGIGHATQLTLTLSVHGTGYSNSWSVWVYPDRLPAVVEGTLLVATAFSQEVDEALEAGRRVLLLADPKRVNSTVPAGFSSIFWNTAWTGKQPPHTLGILCDPNQRLFADFPTESFSTWQWWDLVRSSKSMVLDSLPPALRPLVQVIDDWNTNRKLGLLFEARVRKGSLLVCSIDLTDNLEERPVARQFLHALKEYATSSAFQPGESVEPAAVRRLFAAEED